MQNPNAEILHLSIHSFTPELNGEIRNADLGILYDPSRKEESALAKKIQKNLILIAPDLRVRKNYPYQGKNDGHTTALRKIFPPEKYIGFEIEMNQAYLQKISPQKMAGILMESLFWFWNEVFIPDEILDILQSEIAINLFCQKFFC